MSDVLIRGVSAESMICLFAELRTFAKTYPKGKITEVCERLGFNESIRAGIEVSEVEIVEPYHTPFHRDATIKIKAATTVGGKEESDV